MATTDDLPFALAEALRQNMLRVDHAIHIPTAACVADETSPEPLRDILEDLDDSELQKIFPSLTNDEEYLGVLIDDPGELLHELYFSKHLTGWVLRVATPIRTGFFGRNTFSTSWGYYRTTIVYGDTYIKALARSVSWAKGVEKKCWLKEQSEKGLAPTEPS